MSRTHALRIVPGLVCAAGLLAPRSVQACAACFGKSDDAMAKGMNMGILALLVVVTMVLAALGAFAIFLARRAAKYPLGVSSVEGASPISKPADSPVIAAAPAALFPEPTK